MNITTTESMRVRQEQVRLLYKSFLIIALGGAFATFIIGFLQWNHISHTTIMIWLSVMIPLIVARIFFYFSFIRQQPKVEQIPAWEKLNLYISTATGMTWGAAGIYLFPDGSIEYQAVTLIVLVGMAAGASATLSIIRSHAFIFICLTMIPLNIRLLLEMNEIAISFAALGLFFTLFLLKVVNNNFNNYLDNITLRFRATQREKELQNAESYRLKNSDILEMIAKGNPASDIYDAIALLYESRHAGMRCSMLELHGNKLMHGGAPSLPQSYCEAVHGLENGESIGSCGTSTYTGERVLVEDIATDPKWDKLKDVALPHGLRCCWSEPIKDKEGKVLGAFGMYYNHPALPTADELVDLMAAASLAGIVMERQQRESMLQKLHSAFEYAKDAIMISDLDAKLEYVNPAFEKMTGYAAQEAVGQFIKILRSDKHPASFYAQLEAQDKAGEAWQGEVIIKCKDGSLLEVERTVSPVFDEHGSAIFLVAIQRDLTEHKLLENQFLQAQKMEAVGTLVGGIAHDFNNILAGMTGNLYLLKTHSNMNAQATQKIECMEQLSDRAADLIQQMLTFARKDVVSMSEMSLNQQVSDVFSLVRSSMPDNIEVHLNITVDTLRIQGDTTQIHQVLLNLINNARDALENVAQPCISISLNMCRADDIFVQQRPSFKVGDYALLTIKDNGSGIHTDKLEHIFEPFFTTKDVGKGTGLGLAMVFGAIKRHKGYIEVESCVGKGSSFHVYLPLLKATKPAPNISETPMPNNNAEQGHDELVLLVDDEPLILEMGSEVLESLGYRVLVATDGLEALDLFKTHKNNIALIITDVVMPKLGGIETIKLIREIDPTVKVIFATGYDINTTLNQYCSEHQDPVINKPYPIQDLSALVAQQINKNAPDHPI